MTKRRSGKQATSGGQLSRPVDVGYRFDTPIAPHMVTHISGGQARVQPLTSDGRPMWAPVTMPASSVRYFEADLNRQLPHPPNSGHPAVDSLLRGRGKYLGKGNDGTAYKVGDKVVKISTTVPYQPHNDGHRTPEEAVKHLQHEAEASWISGARGRARVATSRREI